MCQAARPSSDALLRAVWHHCEFAALAVIALPVITLPFVVEAYERRNLFHRRRTILIDPASEDQMTHTPDSDETGYADNYEDVSVFTLSGDREAALLDAQTECTFMWTTAAGDPVGVIMNFVHDDGAFWLTCTRRRKRVPAVEARPRVAIAVSSRGTDIGISQAVTYKGNATVLDDRATLEWFYPLLARKVRPGDEPAQAAFAEHLDSPGRVVIRVDPDTRIGFDSEAMFANSPAGATATRI